ncbi:hypothetical protein DFH08DRAFT_896196 [Mycena albidolilacea]|uniref:Stress-response A/B barrel domain-containing protein n=1 Tax=Mycena albidolilacea TaxID=1033008 RepID=A0AAD7ECU7_9AGAR|nr:hypothetical protein DFH08DRAFT_896196 [Mycena albidolilacea]
MAVQHFTFAKFRPCLTVQEKEDAYKTVFLLLSAALLLPGIRGFKVGPPIDKKGTRGYEFAVSVEFEDLKSFKEYVLHAHHQLVSDFVFSFSEGTPLSYQIDTDRVAKL